MGAESPRDAAILEALKGATAQMPMKYGELTAKLADAGHVLLINELMDALDDLVKRRAVNTARVSRDGGKIFISVCWQTGVPPAPFNAFRSPIKSHTQADAATAHAAQAAAEASRASADGYGSIKSPPAPLYERGEKTQENPMPRIAKPAKPAKSKQPDVIPAAPVPPRRKAAAGAVIAEAMAAVAGRSTVHALRAEELIRLCPAAGSLNSLKATLRSLAAKGRIGVEYRREGGHLLACYYGLATPVLNDGHEKNLDTLRKMRADEHAEAGIPAGAFDAGRLGGGDIHAADPVARAASDLDAPGTTRFALWDDGQLLLAMGDDMMVLDAGATRRLADFLDSVMGL